METSVLYLRAFWACAVLLLAGLAPTRADERIALVVGNGTYSYVPVLPNAQRDAAAVADALRDAGFRTVEVQSNLGYDAMRRTLRDFSAAAETADWAVVYYAGHGIEVGGQNYLVPTDARLKSDRDVQFEAVSLDQVLASIEGARTLRLVILDACRDNPFIPRMTRTDATRSIGRGLSRVEPERGGTLVAYAAKAGQVALDGDGRNSPFVAALVKRLSMPGIEMGKLFRLVRDDVLNATGRRQEPFVYGSLSSEDLYFRPPVPAPGPGGTAAEPPRSPAAPPARRPAPVAAVPPNATAPEAPRVIDAPPPALPSRPANVAPRKAAPSPGRRPAAPSVVGEPPQPKPQKRTAARVVTQAPAKIRPTGRGAGAPGRAAPRDCFLFNGETVCN